MTTNYGGMTPWQYNDYARSRERQGTGHLRSGEGSTVYNSGSSWGLRDRNTNSDGEGKGDPNDPYKDIDRSPFELDDKDALVLAQQQRVRDATAYKFNLAGLPQPIEMWSGNLADTQRTNMPLGTVASLMPGTGAFPGSESYRNYALAREAYMGDPIRAAQWAAQQGAGGAAGGNPPAGSYPATPVYGSGVGSPRFSPHPPTWERTLHANPYSSGGL